MNTCILAGTVATTPVLKVDDRTAFYDFLINVRRTSGKSDLLPVRIGAEIYEEVEFNPGDKIAFLGSLAVYHDDYQKKKIYVQFIKRLSYQGDKNMFHFKGNVRSVEPPRDTPFGRKIINSVIAVGNKADKYWLDCVCWEREFEEFKRYKKNDNIDFYARLESRKYHKNEPPFERIAYDVCISHIFNKNDKENK